MKKNQLMIIAVLAVVTCILPCAAQERAGVVSTQSVHANAAGMNLHFGLGYTYEFATARQFTVLGSIWLKHEYGGTDFFSNKSVWLTFPVISVEPRWYYNLDRRSGKGRSLRMNSGSFLAVTASCFLPSIYGTNGWERDHVHYGINPKWGMRRVFRNNMFIEFQTGVTILTTFKETVAGPDINLKIGYAF